MVWNLSRWFWRDAHFYLVHRFLHFKFMYKIAHSVHHRNINPGPWSSLSMHPVEHLLYFSGVIVHWVILSHPLHAIYHLFHAGLGSANGHIGFKWLLWVLWIVLITIHIMQIYNNQTSWNRIAISINQQDSSRTFKTIFW